MRRSLDGGSSHICTWESLLLTGLLLAACICCTSCELPSAARPIHAPLPVRGSLQERSSLSWFGGLEAEPRALKLPDEGLLGYMRTDQETADTPGGLDIWAAPARDLVMRGSRRERRGARDSSVQFYMWTHPDEKGGVIRSDLNYSVVLECHSNLPQDEEQQLRWTFNGKLCSAGPVLLILRLSPEHLGTYMCIFRNGTQEFSSKPVQLALSDVDPTDPGIKEPYSIFYLTGGSAIGLLVGGILGALALVGGLVFAIIQRQRNDRGRRTERWC